MALLVLDQCKKPLMPCSEKRARLLLDRGRAVVHRMRPFTLRLKDRAVEESVLQPTRIKAQAQAPLEDASAVNTTRWTLFQHLQTTGRSVTADTGGRTPYNRQRQGLPKTHALDTACVGVVTTVTGWNVPTLTVRATGLGRYQRTLQIQTAQGAIQGIAHRHCRRLQRADGYGYAFQPKTVTEDARPANRAMR